ncbi:hypothetical protein SK128_002883 [Halocaridina rubra]|uniref:AB hydrolase-1 domain-containing protein n=1 Tax=Halocaridina rubra TaxID=373956 RepID=A0AAN8WFE4_HALRR
MSFQRNFKRLVLFPTFIITFETLNLAKRIALGIYHLFSERKVPAVVRTPEDRFKGLDAVGYAFKPNYVELPVGGGKTLPRLHYVDEGPKDASEVILCLHGEPSWSFLYRSMIPVFVKAGYRVVAPDFIGFGKSDKYVSSDSYNHELHTMSIRLLLDYLNISSITLVCQDWGGLTGLSVVKDSPKFFSRLVIMNTGLPAGSEFSVNNISRVTPFLMWRSFANLLGTSLPVYNIFQRSLRNPHPTVLQGYNAPFPSSLYKGGAAKWPLLVPITSHSPVAPDMHATRKFLSNQWKNPALVMFSDRDPITKGQDKTFMKLMPHAIAKTVVGAGHFLQEDKGEEIASNIVDFIRKKA